MSRCSEPIRPGALACVIATLAALLVLPAWSAPPQPAAPRFGFGKPASAAEIAGWDIDVRPDGTGLPPGSGSVAQGQAIYDAKCESCHGTFGESNSYLPLAGGVGSLGTDQPVRTTGSKLNYATTLFDYIRRAMPFNAPQTLTPDEVYALTAYVLHLNDILPADAALDRESLPRVKMPNRDGFTTGHGFMTRDGKPDTHNTACMTNCTAEVRLSSQMPDYARDSHGNLDEQVRTYASAAPKAAASVRAPRGADLAGSMGCLACHAAATRVVGPSFREVAQRHAGSPGAEAALVAKVRSGGAGAWGAVPMPAQAQVSERDARALVQWILEGAR